MDLVDAAGREAASLVGAVEVGEHLRRHLPHRPGAEAGADVVPVDGFVALDRVRRPALATQLHDPVSEEVLDGRGRAGVAAFGDLDEQLGPGLLRVTQVAPEHPAHLLALAGYRVSTAFDDELPDTRRPLPHAGRCPELLGHAG